MLLQGGKALILAYQGVIYFACIVLQAIVVREMKLTKKSVVVCFMQIV